MHNMQSMQYSAIERRSPLCTICTYKHFNCMFRPFAELHLIIAHRDLNLLQKKNTERKDDLKMHCIKNEDVSVMVFHSWN